MLQRVLPDEKNSLKAPMDVRSYQIGRVCFLCVDGIPGFARSCSRKESFFGKYDWFGQSDLQAESELLDPGTASLAGKKKSRGMSQRDEIGRRAARCGSS